MSKQAIVIFLLGLVLVALGVWVKEHWLPWTPDCRQLAQRQFEACVAEGFPVQTLTDVITALVKVCTEQAQRKKEACEEAK